MMRVRQLSRRMVMMGRSRGSSSSSSVAAAGSASVPTAAAVQASLMAQELLLAGRQLGAAGQGGLQPEQMLQAELVVAGVRLLLSGTSACRGRGWQNLHD